jgi:nucleoside-diphosphate-sugar epimerase
MSTVDDGRRPIRENMAAEVGMLVAVTGGAGRIGQALQAELRAHGHTTLSVDTTPAHRRGSGYRRADLREMWQAMDALGDAEWIVHLAGVGRPDRDTPHRVLAEQATFAGNVLSSYNVFQVAAEAGVRRVVWASSETVFGPPFDRSRPHYLPLDESHPLQPETSYAVAKATGEYLGAVLGPPAGMTVLALRFSVVMDEEDYRSLPEHWANPALGRWNLWSYVDLRDAVNCCRLALESDLTGSEAFVVAAADTTMRRPSRDLAREFYPDVDLSPPPGEFGSFQDSGKAARLLGYRPDHSWREHL